MAHLQGDQPGDDPDKFGLKFDSDKSRWELLPVSSIVEIIKLFPLFIKHGKEYKCDLLNFNPEILRSSIINDILLWRCGLNKITRKYKHEDGSTEVNTMASVGFKIMYLTKGESYTEEELGRDDSSIRYDLIDLKRLERLVDVYTSGAKKYSDNNWQKVSIERYFGALMRHFSFVDTQDKYDSELGCLHIDQALWNCMSLLWLVENGMEFGNNPDDKDHMYSDKKKIPELFQQPKLLNEEELLDIQQCNNNPDKEVDNWALGDRLKNKS